MTRTALRQRAGRADGELTRNRILEVAGELFADQGFAETPSKVIAARAEVDLAAINYHFGGRDGLYAAVLVEAHRGLIGADLLRGVAEADLSPPEKLHRVISSLVTATTVEGDWRTRVLAQEILSPSSHLRSALQDELMLKLPLLLGLIADIAGIPVDDPALQRCAISVTAPCAAMLVVGRTASPLAPVLRSMSDEDLTEHLYRFAIGGLQAIGEAYRERARANLTAG